jgi:uncharacterized RDD family membrane protein YckC
MESTTETQSIFQELEAERNFAYATTGQRFANYLIDLIPLMVFIFISGVITGIILVSQGINPADSELLTDPLYSFIYNLLTGSICTIIIYTLIEGASNGRSLGKLITRTEVLREDGSRISFKDAFMRSLCRVVPFEPFSAFMAYPWHDRWTKTIVVKKVKKW